MQDTDTAIPRLVRQPEELRAARQALGLSAEQLGQMVRVEGGGRTVRRWEAGEREIPGPVSVVLETAMDFLHQKNELSQQLDRLQSGQMRAGAMQWGGMNQDTTDDNITRIIEARDSLDAALSILTRRPSDRVHWYHLRRMTPKYATPEQDDWSVPGETSCEAALAYFERHSGPGHRLELCNEGDLRAEFLLEQRQLLQTQHGASHRIRAGALVETFYVCRR